MKSIRYGLNLGSSKDIVCCSARRYSTNAPNRTKSKAKKHSTPSSSTHQHPFVVVDEYKAFEALFTQRLSFQDQEPYIRQIRHLKKIEEQRRSGRTSRFHDTVLLNASTTTTSTSSTQPRNDRASKSSGNLGFIGRRQMNEISPEMTSQICYLLNNNPMLSTSDVDNWIKIARSKHADTGYDDRLITRWLNQVLGHMIKQASGRSLPILMELIAHYWNVGFEGINLNQPDSRKLVLNVFNRALDAYDTTTYNIRDHELSTEYGLEQVDNFRYFYELYLDTFEQRTDDEIYDLTFRLAAKSGPIEAADSILSDQLNSGLIPSTDSINVFIKALTNQINIKQELDGNINNKKNANNNNNKFAETFKNDLVAYRAILISENISTQVIEFLLTWCSTFDEIYSVLEIAGESKFSDEILCTCQVPILKAVVRCSIEQDKGDFQVYSKAMAHMFGVLNRFTKCSVGITPEAYDECLLLCAKYGNSAGMHRAIALKMGLESASNNKIYPIPKSIISQVLDRLPSTGEGFVVREQQVSESWWYANINPSYTMDQAVLFHLRSLIDPINDPNLYKQYIAALGRFGLVSRLKLEWKQLKLNDDFDMSSSQDILLEIMSAFRTSNAIDQGLQVLTSILDTTTTKAMGHAVMILKQVFRYEILPLRQTIACVADWFVRHKDQTNWTTSDIEQVFDEIGGAHSITSLSNRESKVASVIGKAVAEAIIQVRQGVDVEASIVNLKQTLGQDI